MSPERARADALSGEVPARLGPPPQRIAVIVDQVRSLVADQFPQWADLPVRAVADGGWDNWTFHLGSEMSVRLPAAAEYALAVEKEHRWLPILAPQLPLPIPTLLGKGEPGAGYPFGWSIVGWLAGESAQQGRITDPVRFASDLADFLVALQNIDPTDGPRPGKHNWFRGGTLRTYDQTLQRALATLGDRVDANRIRSLWGAALEARWDGTPRWFHGDVAAGNLLVNNGVLVSVIDFGTCGIGDPSCDLAAVWTVLTPEGRQVLRQRLDVDDRSWARGRGWALWKTLATCAATMDQPAGVQAHRVLAQVLADEP